MHDILIFLVSPALVINSTRNQCKCQQPVITWKTTGFGTTATFVFVCFPAQLILGFNFYISSCSTWVRVLLYIFLTMTACMIWFGCFTTVARTLFKDRISSFVLASDQKSDSDECERLISLVCRSSYILQLLIKDFILHY